jgi:threonine aldolase
MRKVIADAVVGDDVLGDDPTVISLQEKVALLLQKEAALFVPSGTMANQLAIRTHTEPGDEIIIEASAHVFEFETGALGGLCGVSTRMLSGERGVLSAEQIESAIRPKDWHFPPTKLVTIENTHNQGGGTVYPLDVIKSIRAVCDRHHLALHMDGARLWNAAIASGHSPSQYAAYCDSISVCLSKGLGAPAGSLIVGSRSFISRANRFRKMFGGVMRQSGLLAAAGIFALDHHYERLKEDHANAKYLAINLSRIPNVIVRPEETETNLVYFGLRSRSPQWVEQELRKRGVWLFAERPNEVRAVTHLDVSREDIDFALDVVSTVAAA